MNTIDPPQEQRALVLQGGGALGAYEAGVYKALYDSFVKPHNQPFDIFAGVSIGAVNATILVSHALQNSNRWDDSVITFIVFGMISPDPRYQTLYHGLFIGLIIIQRWQAGGYTKAL